MGIDGIRFSVRCPTGVRDADCSAGILLRAESFQFRYFAFRFIDIELSLFVYQSHAGTVVAAVLKAVKAFNQNRIRFALPDVTNYSTHRL